MSFAKKLQQAMSNLNLNQRQVSDLTGKSRASVSQYLSDGQVPPIEVQREIATSLGLAPDYFLTGHDKLSILPLKEVRNGVIPRMKPEEAARLMGMGVDSIRRGLEQKVFPWGYAVKTSETKHTYFINARVFAEKEMVDLCELNLI